MTRGRVIGCALACALFLLPHAAQAADRDKNVTEAFLYVWGTSMAGDVDIPQGKASFNVPFSDLWDNLNGAVMARMRSQIGKVSLEADLFYADLESDREFRQVRVGPRGNITVPLDAKVEAQVWIGDATIGYTVLDLDEVLLAPRAELYAGARIYNVWGNLDYNVGNNSGDFGDSHGWIDAIVGARIGLALSKTVEMGIQGDVGGFNYVNSSKFAWSQITSLSWRFAESWRMHLGYKFLEFKKEPDSANKVTLQLRGPFVAVSTLF